MNIKYNTGFSLIEILVAFSIAAVSLGIIFNIYAKGTTAAILGEEYAQAIAIAESKLAASGISENMDRLELNGNENSKYAWSMQIVDFETDSDFNNEMELKKIEIEVNWQSRGKVRSVKLQSLKPVFVSDS